MNQNGFVGHTKLNMCNAFNSQKISLLLLKSSAKALLKPLKGKIKVNGEAHFHDILLRFDECLGITKYNNRKGAKELVRTITEKQQYRIAAIVEEKSG